MNRFSSFKPLMHEHEYKFVEKYLNKNDVLLEWGSGNSTLYFSDFVSKVISIEHDIDYYHSIKKCIDAYSAENILLFHVEPTVRDQTIDRYAQLKDYIEFPVKQKFIFNKILIDGRARKHCALFLHDHILEDHIIFIHDFNYNNQEGYIDKNFHEDLLSKYTILDIEKRGQGIVALKKKDSKIKVYNSREDLIRSFSSNLNVCEIGVFKGDFSKFIYNNINPANLVLIDIFEGTTHSGDKDGKCVKYADLDLEYKNLKEYFKNHNTSIYKGKSQDVLSNFEDNYFDIIYIDGDHSYAGVFNDLKTSFLKTKVGGVICGHDYSLDFYSQTVFAVQDFCKIYNQKINYLTNDRLPSFGITKT